MRPRPHLVAAAVGLGAIALTLSACGSTSSGGSSAAASGGSSAPTMLHQGIVVASASQNFAKAMSDGATAAAQNAGNIDFQTAAPPQVDGPAEVQLFQNMVTTQKDGVIEMNLNPPLFTRPAADAISAGVPVVALDIAPTPGSNITFFVGNDNYDLGAQMATELLKRLGSDPKGEVVIGVPNPAAPALASRAQGIKETLNKSAPGITVLGPYETYSEPTKNYDAWSAQVHAHPNALAFLGVGDADSYDLAKLKTEQNGTWQTAGFDVDGKTLQAVKDGVNFMTMDPEHYLKGYIAEAILADSGRTKKPLPQGWFTTPGLVVTSANIDEVIKREADLTATYNWYKPQIDKLLGDVQSNVKPMDQVR